MRATVTVLCWLGATPALAASPCDQAAMQAAADRGVPFPILTAITRAETGTRRDGAFGPWPWTINHAGKGEWFATQEDALTRIEALVQSGASLDVGCFQINTRWHGAGFASARDMIDPARNADYAARYLTELFAETGDWKAAVAAYHSRDPDRGAGYADRVARLMRDPATPVDAAAPAIAGLPRVNTYPLLLAGDPASAGSLFAAVNMGEPLFGAGTAPLVAR